MTLLNSSASISRERFDAFAALLGRELHADMVLSSPGYPAETASIVGVHPVAELIFNESTTPDDVKRFCFNTPGMTIGYVSYTYGMLLRGIESAKPLDFPLGHLKKYAATVEFHGENDTATIIATDQGLLEDLYQRLTSVLESTSVSSVPGVPNTPPVVSLNRVGYEAGVRETLERILSGYTYQLNLSTKFHGTARTLIRWPCFWL